MHPSITLKVMCHGYTSILYGQAWVEQKQTNTKVNA